MFNKKYIAILLFLTAFFIIGTPIIFAQSHSVCFRNSNSLTNNDTFSVGEVRTSILDESDFLILNGREWVLMDGRSLEEPIDLTPYIVHLDNKIPDARGRFLRMIDKKEIVDHDDDKRKLGSSQEDALQNLEGRTSGIPIPRSDDIQRITGGVFEKINEGSDTFGILGAMIAWPAEGIKFDASKALDPNKVPVKTNPYETRPANIAVNYFIKVCKCRTSNCN